MDNVHPLTPDRHKDGEDDGGAVVKEIGDLGERAGVLELPVGAVEVALRAHGHVAHPSLVADVQAGGGEGREGREK